MSKRAALVPLLLLAGLIVAVVGATAALRLIGDGAFGPGGQTLTQANVQASLAQPTHQSTASAGPSQPSGTHGSPSAVVSDNFTASGNVVIAACSSGRATLTSWIPAQGYGIDGLSGGPGAKAWVKFKSGSAELTVNVTCKGGRPSFTTSADDHHGGRGSGGSGH